VNYAGLILTGCEIRSKPHRFRPTIFKNPKIFSFTSFFRKVFLGAHNFQKIQKYFHFSLEVHLSKIEKKNSRFKNNFFSLWKSFLHEFKIKVKVQKYFLSSLEVFLSKFSEKKKKKMLKFKKIFFSSSLDVFLSKKFF